MLNLTCRQTVEIVKHSAYFRRIFIDPQISFHLINYLLLSRTGIIPINTQIDAEIDLFATITCFPIVQADSICSALILRGNRDPTWVLDIQSKKRHSYDTLASPAGSRKTIGVPEGSNTASPISIPSPPRT